MLIRPPYNGQSRKLVVAIDIGTTYSGVSYCVLDPGEVPEIKTVTRYPAQEGAGGNSKIPSIIYYDRRGDVRAVGAEALRQDIIQQAEEEGWSRAEWFKLHLRPKARSLRDIRDTDVPPLPANKTATEVYADYLRYLNQCIVQYIVQSHANGQELVDSIQNNIDFVLSHPNGWEGEQQSQMRSAAVLAGLIPGIDDFSTKDRIQFVTEGEASLHFCISNSLCSAAITSGKGVIVVDAGGGTVDLNAYYMKHAPNVFEEIAAPQCRLQGSVFVSQRARTFLQGKLRGSRFGTPEDIENMTTTFDKTTKLGFKSVNDSAHIKFGTQRDNDNHAGIRNGTLKLTGPEVAEMFRPSVIEIAEAVNHQRRRSSRTVHTILLVGGFAASDYLFEQLKSMVQTRDCTFARPDQHVSKAVSDGAVSFYLDHFVAARVSGFSFGTQSRTYYDEENPAHLRRRENLVQDLSGQKVTVPNHFSTIVSKGARIPTNSEFKRWYYREKYHPSDWERISIPIYRYAGRDEATPEFTDDDPEGFHIYCTIKAETGEMIKSVRPTYSVNDTEYLRLKYCVILFLGLTELQAQLCWFENGEEKRCPARIQY